MNGGFCSFHGVPEHACAECHHSGSAMRHIPACPFHALQERYVRASAELVAATAGAIITSPSPRDALIRVAASLASARADHAALVRLLTERGVFCVLDYMDAVCEQVEQENESRPRVQPASVIVKP